MRKQQQRRLISAFVFHVLVGIISPDSVSEISNLKLASVAEQADLLHYLNQFMTDGLSHPYYLDEHTMVLVEPEINFHFYFIFR